MAKKEGNETPLMQQYYATKAKYPDAILLYRMGDFYETFGADAITTSRILGITLTKRSSGSPGTVELAVFLITRSTLIYRNLSVQDSG